MDDISDDDYFIKNAEVGILPPVHHELLAFIPQQNHRHCQMPLKIA